MITSGLVLTLNADAALAEQAVASLRTRPEFTPGERSARWLPVALEAADDDASRVAHDWLNALSGVDFVDVVYVNFEDAELDDRDKSVLHMQHKLVQTVCGELETPHPIITSEKLIPQPRR